MYTVSKAPTRIINRTRRDIPLKLENLEINRELRRKNSGGSDDSDHIIMSSPRPTFQTNLPSKGPRNGRTNSHTSHQDTSPALSPSHLEIVNYFANAWATVQQELENQKADSARQNGHDDRGTPRILVYEEKEPHPAFKDFKPFELEAWWGKRLYHKLTEN